jgi:hypothetical protein
LGEFSKTAAHHYAEHSILIIQSGFGIHQQIDKKSFLSDKDWQE